MDAFVLQPIVGSTLVPIYLDSGVPLHSSASRVFDNARNTLMLLADESGGLFYRARRIEDLKDVYQQVIDDLGQIYSLGYRPTNDKHDGSWRKVKIEIRSHPELQARARPGYYAN